MQREKRQGGENGKVYLFFVDLKAAFDKVNRSRLWKELRRKEVKEDLVRRVEKIYEETEVTVRTGQRLTRSLQDDERSVTGMCNESTLV